MPKIKQLAKRGKAIAAKAYKAVETRVLVAEGRKAVREKKEATVRVAKKATRTGLVVGGLAAAMVVAREMKKRKAARG